MGPISSKIIVTKEKEKEEKKKRKKEEKKSDEKERRTREKSNGCTLRLYNGYLKLAPVLRRLFLSAYVVFVTRPV